MRVAPSWKRRHTIARHVASACGGGSCTIRHPCSSAASAHSPWESSLVCLRSQGSRPRRVPDSRRSSSSLRLALIPASELAVQIVSYLVTTTVASPSPPKLSFSDGIPDEWRTLVVVPEILTTPDSVRNASGAAGDPLPGESEIRTCALPCSPIFQTPPVERCRRTTRSSWPRWRAPTSSIAATRDPRSHSSIAGAGGARASRSGWAGSGSGASWRSSTVC